MKTILISLTIAAVLAVPSVAALAQSTPSPIRVTPDNFTRAETDMYFKLWAGDGAFGKFVHFRDFPLEKTGVRPNRDTLYSESVFDLDAGPVTITIPDAGDRFMSMIVMATSFRCIHLRAGSPISRRS